MKASRNYKVTIANGGPENPPVTEPSPSGTKVIFHGDSITAGANATNPSLSYSAKYAQATGYNVQTMAQYSRTIQEGVQSWNNQNSLQNVVFSPTPDQQQYSPIIPYDSSYRYLVFRLGINDCIQKAGSNTTVSTFKSTYKSCLQHFMAVAGWPNYKIKLIGIGSYFGTDTVVLDAITPYNNAMVELAQELSIEFLDIRAFDSENGAQALYDDIVHPNDNGHLKHAEYLSQRLS